MSVRVMRVGHVWMSVRERLMYVRVGVAGAWRDGWLMFMVVMVVSRAVNVRMVMRQC